MHEGWKQADSLMSRQSTALRSAVYTLPHGERQGVL